MGERFCGGDSYAEACEGAGAVGDVDLGEVCGRKVVILEKGLNCGDEFDGVAFLFVEGNSLDDGIFICEGYARDGRGGLNCKNVFLFGHRAVILSGRCVGSGGWG